MKILAITNMIVPDIDDDQLRTIREAAGPQAEVVVARSRATAETEAPGTEILLGTVDEALFAAMPELRWIQATASGVDFMLFPAIKDGDVVITCEKGLVGSHLADHAMALLLALTRKLAAAVRAGPDSWSRRMDYRRAEIELEGLTLGIVGFGGTGRALARRAAGFGMQIRAVDRAGMAGNDDVAQVEPPENLEALLAASDVVALCAPLTEETSHLMDSERFARMKPGAILLNVTRGELIEHGALVAALESGRLGGAGLDVHHQEPLPADDPLWAFENVVMTPHTAGASQLRAGRNLSSASSKTWAATGAASRCSASSTKRSDSSSAQPGHAGGRT